MTSQKYRNELARRTSTEVIKDEDIKHKEMTDSEQSTSDKDEIKMTEGHNKENKDGESSSCNDSNDVISDDVILGENKSISCSSLNDNDDKNSKDIEDNVGESQPDNSDSVVDQKVVNNDEEIWADECSSHNTDTNESIQHTDAKVANLTDESGDAIVECDTTDVDQLLKTENESNKDGIIETTKTESEMSSDIDVTSTNNEQLENDINNQTVDKVDTDALNTDETGDAKVSD